MADPKIRILADSKKALAKIAKLQRQVDNIGNKLQRVGKKSKTTSPDFSQG